MNSHISQCIDFKASLPAKSRVCFWFCADVWLQPDTVTAKHLILFSLCEDVLHVPEAALNEDIIGIDRGWVFAFQRT